MRYNGERTSRSFIVLDRYRAFRKIIKIHWRVRAGLALAGETARTGFAFALFWRQTLTEQLLLNGSISPLSTNSCVVLRRHHAKPLQSCATLRCSCIVAANTSSHFHAQCNSMHPPSASVVSSLKRLSGSKWHHAYGILLGFKSGPNSSTSSSQSVPDIANALRLAGKNDSADNLDELLTFFPEDEAVLELLVELSGNPLARRDEKRSGFTLEYCSIQPKVEWATNPFAFDESNFTSAVTDNQPLEPDDWLSQAAKALMRAEEQAFQIQSTSLKPEHVESRQLCNRDLARTKLESVSQGKDSVPTPALILPSLNLVLFTLLNPCSEEGNLTASVSHALPRTRLGHCQDEAEMERLRRNYFSSRPYSEQQRREYVIIVPEPPDNFMIGSGSISNEAVLKRARFCGELYLALSSFASAYRNSSGRILSAVSEFAGELAQRYHASILQALASAERGDETEALIWAALHAAEESTKDSIHVVGVLSRIEQSSGCASAVLNIVLDALRTLMFCENVRELFYSALSPYLELILDWVFMASTNRDLGLEFFGSILGSRSTDSEELLAYGELMHPSEPGNAAVFPDFLTKETASFILRSGRSRTLLELLSPNHPVLGMQPETKFGRLNAGLLVSLARSVQQCVTNERDCGLSSVTSSEIEHVANETEEAYSPCIEDSLMKTVVDESFFCFPSEHSDCVLRQEKLGFHLPCEQGTGLSLSARTASFGEEPIESPVLLFEKHMIRNLRVLDLVVQKEILRYFSNELHVFDHFRVLRDYALLGAGDFADVLVDQMNEAEIVSRKNEQFITRRVQAARTFYGSSEAGRATIRVQRHLASCFRAATNASSAEERSFIDRLSVGVGEWSDDTDSLWKQTLEVEYEVEFPLDMVISPLSLTLYSKFFYFFLSVHRARKCLGSLYRMTRQTRSALYPSRGRIQSHVKQYLNASLWQFCIHADHFVSIVGGYQFNQLHAIGWHEFESSWNSVTSVWELCNEHLTFLANTLRTTLLAEKQAEVLRVINSAFESIYAVESAVSQFIESVHLSPRGMPFKKLFEEVSKASRKLKKSARFLVVVLEKLCALDSNEHLKDFLTRLNFNGYYDNDEQQVFTGKELSDVED